MYTLRQPNSKRWTISKDGKPVLFGIGSAHTALAVAKAHGIVIGEFKGYKNVKLSTGR